MISPQIAISGFLRKWMCCSIILLEHNPAMSSLRHNSLESHSKNHQCKHVWSTNMTCPEITMVVRTYQVCALTMFALSLNFRVVVSEVSFHYGADHYGACQYDDSTMAQVQLGASRYGAFHYGAGPVWRCFSLAHSSMAQAQYGAFHYGAVPGWRFEASS